VAPFSQRARPQDGENKKTWKKRKNGPNLRILLSNYEGPGGEKNGEKRGVSHSFFEGGKEERAHREKKNDGVGVSPDRTDPGKGNPQEGERGGGGEKKEARGGKKGNPRIISILLEKKK